MIEEALLIGGPFGVTGLVDRSIVVIDANQPPRIDQFADEFLDVYFGVADVGFEGMLEVGAIAKHGHRLVIRHDGSPKENHGVR